MQKGAILFLLVGGYLVANKYFPRLLDFGYSPIETSNSASVEVGDDLSVNVVRDPVASSRWKYPARAAQYIPAIKASEDKYGIPRDLLGRLLYQESKFDPKIIFKKTGNMKGAIGIAQIIPRWHPGVDPTEPFQSIDYAGKYLAENFRRFGNWKGALIAYNWGPSAYAEFLAGKRKFIPLESMNYYSQILGDTGYGLA